MKGIKLILLAIFVLKSATSIYAHVSCIQTYDRLVKLINEKEICVAYFYHYVHTCRDRQKKLVYKEQSTIFKAMSRLQKYKDAGVGFLMINTALPTLTRVACEYDISCTPTYLLFKDGQPYEKQSVRACKEGCATKADLIALIEDNVAHDIKQIVQAKEELRQRQLQENLWWYQYYGYPWYGYSGPCGWGSCSPWYGSCGRGGFCFNYGIGFCR